MASSEWKSAAMFFTSMAADFHSTLSSADLRIIPDLISRELRKVASLTRSPLIWDTADD
jgi:hypothetical protein